jgi:RNA polymerase sigma-70 factor (ECF subfamily)
VNHPGLPSLEDAELLRRFNDGEPAAFEVLLERYRRPLYNFILRSVQNQQTAEDLLQDVFLRVVQRAREFKGESKFSTWLYTIARNRCIDTQRKQSHRRHRSLDAPAGQSDEGQAAPLAERVPGREPGTDRQAIAGRLQDEIARAVETLPEDQREVFLMRQLDNMPFKEIAEVVGVPENTVKSRMRYALERLQQALAEYRDYVPQLK